MTIKHTAGGTRYEQHGEARPVSMYDEADALVRRATETARECDNVPVMLLGVVKDLSVLVAELVCRLDDAGIDL